MTSQEEIEAALIDVRKAYRLLVVYQQLARDLCVEIAGRLNEFLTEPIIFRYWVESLYDHTPQRATSPVANQWSWTFLPLYDFCILYRPEGQDDANHKPGDWMFAIRVTADSGFQQGKGEPDPLEFKLHPGESQTLVRVYAYVCIESFQRDWIEFFFKNDFPPDTGAVRDLEAGVRVLGARGLFSDMQSKESVRRYVGEFVAAMKAGCPEKTQW